jgi:transcriptional regulator with XRE-family HTH domain
MTTKKREKFNLKSLNKNFGPISIGSFLRSWRLCEEVTQKEFAAQLGMSPANLCDIEKERKGISIEKAAEIAKIIGYSPTVLIGLALAEQLRAAGLDYEIDVKPSRRKKAAS